MVLQAMQRNALIGLKNRLEECYDRYYSEETNEWILELCGENPFIDLMEINDFELADLSLPKGEIDIANCKILYSKLKEYFTPSQASDERLWAGLCNGTFYGYVKKRWGYTGEIQGDKRTNVLNITSRYFFGGGMREGVYKNTLSKYWWVGYLLYDEKNSNHFWKLDVLGANDLNSKITTIFRSNNFSSNKEITDGILKSLEYFQKKGVHVTVKNHIRPSIQLLNAIGGNRILDELTSDEIAEIFTTNIENIINKKKMSLNISDAYDFNEELDDE